MNYMPTEEFQKVHNNSNEIESLSTSLNAVYIDAKDMMLDVKYNNKQIMFLFSTEYDKVHSL
jgi:hypothetical protein